MVTPHLIESWHMEALPKATQRALVFFSRAAWLKKSSWYLAGGTALALQIGHRKSVDLDFFSPAKKFQIAALLHRLDVDEWHTDTVEEGTVHGQLFGAKVSFIVNPSFLPRVEPHWYGSVRVLDKRDIAVMKIIAVSQRGRKRDFMDLYWYVSHVESLEDIFRRLPDQYPSVAHDLHHMLKSLIYFQDADVDPDPLFLTAVSWQATKKYFRREVPKLAKALLRLTA